MVYRKIFSILLSLLISSFFYFGCSPSSYSIRYKSNEGVNTFEDSVSVGLIVPDSDEMVYYSQSQDTSSEFQYLDDEEDITNDDAEIDISSVLEKLRTSAHTSDSDLVSTTPQERMLIEIIKYLNTPYKYGGNSQDGIDCSAFTQNVFSNSLDINLNRSAREQFTQGFPVRSKENLIFGDLVFFNTRRAVRPGHVGIYIGDNLFAHASSKKGVIVSSLTSIYFSKRFMGGRRIDQIFSTN